MFRVLAILLILSAPAAGQTLRVGTVRVVALRVVAAESVYADIARQIGGPGAAVRAILLNPAQDPHLFEPSPAVARALTHATLVIYNGANYDPWMRPLLAATGGSGPRRVIDVADLVHAASAGNPHLWYAPETVPALAAALAQAFTNADPAHAADYARRLATLRAALDTLGAQIAAIRARHAGTMVAATEPVFGLMLAALGLRVSDAGFQHAIMNGTEPSADQIAGLEADFTGHRVRALIRNIQTEDAATTRLAALARAAGIPVIGVSETEPPDTSYQDWVGGQLAALDAALGPR